MLANLNEYWLYKINSLKSGAGKTQTDGGNDREGCLAALAGGQKAVEAQKKTVVQWQALNARPEFQPQDNGHRKTTELWGDGTGTPKERYWEELKNEEIG